MRLYLGGYPFDDNEIQFSYNKKLILSKANRRERMRHQMKVRGVKQRSTAADLTIALQELEFAVGQGGDLIFKDNDGNNTVHAYTESNTLNGIRAVGGVNYPPGLPGVWGARTEYVNARTYEIVFEWDTADVESNLIYWSQQIVELSSGGFDFVVQEALTGFPQQQQTAQYTKQVFQQVGRAVGFSSYPNFPGLAYPSVYLRTKQSRRTLGDPINWNVNQFTHYPISWVYHYEAPFGLALGSPATPIF